jgi:C4-dicarboxylate transporter DctM subunit
MAKSDAPESLTLAAITMLLLVTGMFLDAISIYFIFLPLLLPIAAAYGWDPLWLGILITMNLAIGQFTPPMAVNLMVTSRLAGVQMEATVPWVAWMVAAMLLALGLVVLLPEIALWLPRLLGYL